MKTLNLIIDAMTEVVARKKELYMPGFYREQTPSIDTTIHTCGTAACVLGYTALKVPDVERRSMFKAGSFLWVDLIVEIGGPLADAIAMPSSYDRRYALLQEGTADHLQDHNHVTLDNPTAEDALDFILKVKEFVDENA
jgi:hypothetical protein